MADPRRLARQTRPLSARPVYRLHPMLARRSLFGLAMVSAALIGCAATAPKPAGSTADAAPIVPRAATADEAPGGSDVPAATEAPPPSRSVEAEAPAPPVGLVVVGARAPLALTAPSYPRIDRARRVVTVADTGDDRYAFQSSLSLVELRPGATRGQVVFEVFSRERFEALENDPPALGREIARAALLAHTKLGTRVLGQPMSACAVARRETDDAASCAQGQTVRCGDLVATFEGKRGALRHPGGTARHPHWAKTTLRSSEHAASFEVVACLREAAWDAETRTMAALVDRQCVASGGDWCSREPVWTVVALSGK